ncbi:isocitrate lyase/PEP mutase family protein [Lacticaseibacillus manihotivorans]|jgi:methylisocitrate lyase|uniref:Carboxyvinyl-carboxyphosphonate phosphorylmutase n=3 Tax=Lacticaseibacillus manihotivorans TaxID=88233 RepID=A0A0R1QQ89_9LACO|nr:isocitrate lyase/PEP mutase family protein [Lacticaseibacillus manihotivorans]KRL44458.1 carboxyvinyl-carboxyphosphonate phosphorylmutase [Lacticaseibacillus manihotivorans DSM 13343 = JCM 12514]QFQ92100.1 carboxyvinyl-carboxyphosphonate phosphorylmutase [Lacticaseibacillus manihotivorans]
MTKADLMRKTFKDMVFSDQIIRMLVAPDALGAKVAQHAGADAIFAAGYATSAANLAMPDRGLADFGEMLEKCRQIVNATTVPVFADADTGYGDLSNVRRTVQSYEQIGAAGLFLEDQTWPKRCGHMDNKSVEPTEVLEAKIRTAKAARKHDDFLIMSRTDARAVYDLDEAIARSKRYQAAGADMVFIEAPRNLDELTKIHEAFPNTPLMANMIEGGKTPLTDTAKLRDLGFRIVVYPTAMTYARAFADEQLVETLIQTGSTKSYEDRMITFDKFNHFVGLDQVNAREAQYDAKHMAAELATLKA